MKVYLCGVSYQHELGEAADGVTVYPSMPSIKKYDTCSNSGCGIVECEIKFNRWVEEQDFEKMVKNSIHADEMTKYQISDVKEKIKELQKFLVDLETLEKYDEWAKSNPPKKTDMKKLKKKVDKRRINENS